MVHHIYLWISIPSTDREDLLVDLLRLGDLSGVGLGALKHRRIGVPGNLNANPRHLGRGLGRVAAVSGPHVDLYVQRPCL